MDELKDQSGTFTSDLGAGVECGKVNAPKRIWAWTTGIQPASQSAGLWQENAPSGQPSGVEYIRADLSQAAVAAALREAADMLIDLGHVSESGETLAAEVLAMIPDTGALDRALEKAREEEREACARIAKNRAVPADSPADTYGAGWAKSAERIAAHICARGEGVEG